ncbi:pyroglutamyl-peptidase I [Yersinia massiliensis]|uniref:Pyrrolidone-carboxylate peptidase n=1 Tax=Yersinia massiliensis TaxID=419257 RepID=A0AA90XW72_9GAMM|nr:MULTISPECIES: pyroglutamyl-peptidase I [Yersinia]MDA5547437.1 pyroglutamyl-peptidase I [Yersinia massiliensis]NIL25473.1 pyroglutamyl-peptidase I [Yersinia massiliensis]OWF72796.1 pyroglutamyl-peptidase I [Yersinia frederiksenii]PHZ24407.1 pyroglutamyl-peptidase I [Yersinia massiliensis]UZM77854.1 pyroglutamyl-peptidase I [Yersinia massiliensis]
MKSVLITGFEPFGGERVNPSWEVVKQLNDLMLGGVRVVARQLPCAFGEALTALNAAMDDVQPTLVLAIGQAGGRADITIERVAINIDDARIPDNLGHQPVDQPIVEGGPAAYFTRLPIKAMVQGIRDAGIPASVSQTAGTYVCNHVMYGLLHRLNQMNSDVKGGFIHIPYLPEQAVAHPGAPSMSTQSVLIALELAISVALQIEHDLHISGGAIH